MEPVSTSQAAKDYLTRTVTPTLLKGLTELCKKKPADPIVSDKAALFTLKKKYLTVTNVGEQVEQAPISPLSLLLQFPRVLIHWKWVCIVMVAC